jgi:hypothetical protein
VGEALGYAQIGLDIRPALINGAVGAVTFLTRPAVLDRLCHGRERKSSSSTSWPTQSGSPSSISQLG